MATIPVIGESIPSAVVTNGDKEKENGDLSRNEYGWLGTLQLTRDEAQMSAEKLESGQKPFECRGSCHQHRNRLTGTGSLRSQCYLRSHNPNTNSVNQALSSFLGPWLTGSPIETVGMILSVANQGYTAFFQQSLSHLGCRGVVFQ